MFNPDKYKKYIFLFFLIIIFFLYGLLLSEIIDYIFNEHDESIEDYKIALEIIGEIGVAYLIYFSLKKYSLQIIEKFFKSISISPPNYLNQLLLFAFSTGIFKNLQKSTEKINYFRNKIKFF
jgi:hypothetical protein